MVEFLQSLNDKFDIHIYTAGTRTYATQVARIMDAEMQKQFQSASIEPPISKDQHAIDIITGSVIPVTDNNKQEAAENASPKVPNPTRQNRQLNKKKIPTTASPTNQSKANFFREHHIISR